MSCIDSAIIKALVEHIGMDPDSVGGSSATTSVINAPWSTTEREGYNLLTFQLPEGESIKFGTCLKLNGDSQNGMPDEFIVYCVNIEGNTLTFSTVDAGDVIVSKDSQGKYVLESLALGFNLKAIPDNKTFGLFKTTTFNDYIPVIDYILDRTNYLRKQIASHTDRIMALEDKV